MSNGQKFALFILRVGMGWVMFYDGITKILNPNWSAEGYLKGTKMFPELYMWFLQPDILPLANFLNKWGLTLLGVSLILGVGVRFASILGALLMILYYFPVLDFPYAGGSYIVDNHIIYALMFLYFAAVRAGRIGGLENWASGIPILRGLPALHRWWG